jgi:hypothetical protein
LLGLHPHPHQSEPDGECSDAEVYKIERRSEDDSALVFVQHVDLETSCSDTGLISDRMYHYRVYAYQGEAVSAPSNIASAKTQRAADPSRFMGWDNFYYEICGARSLSKFLR